MADSATVSYQGVLRDATLNPVANGGYAMEFSIYDADMGGTELWGPEQYPSVAVTNGMFSVYLGSIEPLGTLFADHAMLWLEISADTGAGVETYAPRVPLASVPYAQHAKHAGTADHADSASHADTAGSAADADALGGQPPSAYANAGHAHAGGDITSGTVPFLRLPVGAASNQVAAGNHTHPADPPFSSGSGWVRIGNRQICWGTYATGGATTTFPVSFSSTPAIVCTPRHATLPRYATIQARSATGFTAGVWTETGGTSGVAGEYIAVGNF
jgi:hypothetical protein